MRVDSRKPNELRSIEIIKDYIVYPEGSVLIQMGNTKVICNASVEEKVPPFKKDSGEGFVTAEYSMLPRSTHERMTREIAKLKKDNRGVEIQRLIGRSLRAVVDMKKLGERTITVDCDVIQADGGTRTASITGGYVALALACRRLVEMGVLAEDPIIGQVSAVSVGLLDDTAVLDLCYKEDSKARVDMNVIMTDRGEFIEVQGTGEDGAFSRRELDLLLDLAEKGNREIQTIQYQILNDK